MALAVAKDVSHFPIVNSELAHLSVFQDFSFPLEKQNKYSILRTWAKETIHKWHGPVATPPCYLFQKLFSAHGLHLTSKERSHEGSTKHPLSAKSGAITKLRLLSSVTVREGSSFLLADWEIKDQQLCWCSPTPPWTVSKIPEEKNEFYKNTIQKTQQQPKSLITSAQVSPQIKNMSHLHRALIKVLENEFGALLSTTCSLLLQSHHNCS